MNRPAMFLLVSVKVNSKRRFSFSWPFPLIIVLMFSDMLVDIAEITAVFKKGKSVKKEKREGRKVPMDVLTAFARCFDSYLREPVIISAPWEIFFIETDKVQVKLSVH